MIALGWLTSGKDQWLLGSLKDSKIENRLVICWVEICHLKLQDSNVLYGLFYTKIILYNVKRFHRLSLLYWNTTDFQNESTSANKKVNTIDFFINSAIQCILMFIKMHWNCYHIEICVKLKVYKTIEVYGNVHGI